MNFPATEAFRQDLLGQKATPPDSQTDFHRGSPHIAIAFGDHAKSTKLHRANY